MTRYSRSEDVAATPTPRGYLFLLRFGFAVLLIAHTICDAAASQDAQSLNPKGPVFDAWGDGTHDDTIALRRWAAALSARHGQGRLPCGTFVFKQTLVFGTDVSVYGDGPCAVLRYEGDGDAILVTAVSEEDPAGGAGNNRFEEFQLVRRSAATAGAGFHMQNASDFVLANLRIHDFFHGILVEGGDAGAIQHPEIRGGTFYGAPVPGSASIAVEPYNYVKGGLAKYACANSLAITNPDIGGNGLNYNVEAGLKITCVDGLYLSSGHIGAVQNDVEITRVAGRHMNVQSIEINGYLDGSRRAVYVAPLTGAAGPDGTDPSGGHTAHLRLKPFQIANQFGNAIEIDDPTADVGISDVDFAHVEGWGVYAPRVRTLSVLDSKFETVGHPDRGTGGILIGSFSEKALRSGPPGSASAVTIEGNQFFAVADCIDVLNAREALVEGNLTQDCRTGRSR